MCSVKQAAEAQVCVVHAHMYVYVVGVYRGQKKCVSIEQNIEDTGGSGKKCVCVQKREREARDRKKLGCAFQLHCFDSTKEL